LRVDDGGELSQVKVHEDLGQVPYGTFCIRIVRCYWDEYAELAWRIPQNVLMESGKDDASYTISDLGN